MKIVIFLLSLNYFAQYSTIANAVKMQLSGRLGYFEKIECACPQIKNKKIAVDIHNYTVVDTNLLLNFTISILEDIPGNDFVFGLRIEKCKSKENLDSCQEFADLRSNKFCSIVSSGKDKRGYFSFATDMKPPLRCPLKKGVYRKEDESFDMKLFPVTPSFNGFYWRLFLTFTNENLRELLTCCNVEAALNFVRS